MFGDLIFLAFWVAVIGLVVFWPYLLGTWLAVEGGAGMHSSARSTVGWLFEVVIGGVEIGLVVRAVRTARATVAAASDTPSRWVYFNE